MPLSNEVLYGFNQAIAQLPLNKTKNVYQIKILYPRLNDSIFYSCRFKNRFGNTFLLSIEICLKDTHPVARSSIHLFCPRRIFSKTIFLIKEKLQPEETLSILMKNIKYINYYNIDRILPNSILIECFKKHLEKETILYIDYIKNEDMKW